MQNSTSSQLTLKTLVILLLIGCCAPTIRSFSQNDTNTFGIEGNIMGGRIFKHTSKFNGPIPTFSYGFDANMIWKTNGKKDWHYRRQFPKVGLGICYTVYDKEYYGQGIGVYPNLELPLIKKTNCEWTIRFGMGLGLINKQYRPFAPFWDTINNAMGSQINNYSLLNSDLRYSINEHWQLQAGFSFTHMSSARFRQPNLGINFMGGHLVVRYFPATKTIIKKETIPIKLPNRILIQARQGIALVTRESPGSAATPVVLSCLSVSKRYWGKNKILLGLDYSYNQNVYDFLRIQAIEPSNEKKYAWNTGVFLGHEFLFGFVGLQLQFGAYVKQTLLPKAPIYQRIGMNWYLLQNEKGFVKELYISTILKTHYATAELAELGLGMSF